MSWSAQGVGIPAKVAEKLYAEIRGQKCSEPEESYKNTVATLLSEMLANFPDTHAVKVTANGSMSTYTQPDGQPMKTSHHLFLEIQPIWNFIA